MCFLKHVLKILPVLQVEGVISGCIIVVSLLIQPEVTAGTKMKLFKSLIS